MYPPTTSSMGGWAAPTGKKTPPPPSTHTGATSSRVNRQSWPPPPQALVVLTGWVFSAWGHNFVRTMVRLGGQHETLRVIDDQIGGPTWAGPLAQVLHALALRPAGDTPGGVYHFGGHPWISWHGFAREILARAHALGLIARLPSVEAIA